MNLETGETDTPLHPLVSPEGTRLELVVSGPAPRMFAYAFDLLFVAVILLLLLLALFGGLRLSGLFERLFRSFADAARVPRHGRLNPPALGPLGGIVLAIFILLQSAVETGYFIFWEMLTNGRSPGKAAIGLRVVRRNGYPIDLRSSLIRNVMRFVDILPAYYAVGLISILLSPSGERLGDHAAGTIVIRLDRPPSAPEIEGAPESPTIALTRDQIARIGPRELRLIRATLRRVSNLEPDRRRALLAEVTETLRARLEIAQAPADQLTFLHDLLLLTERYSRTYQD